MSDLFFCDLLNFPHFHFSSPPFGGSVSLVRAYSAVESFSTVRRTFHFSLYTRPSVRELSITVKRFMAIDMVIRLNLGTPKLSARFAIRLLRHDLARRRPRGHRFNYHRKIRSSITILSISTFLNRTINRPELTFIDIIG